MLRIQDGNFAQLHARILADAGFDGISDHLRFMVRAGMDNDLYGERLRKFGLIVDARARRFFSRPSRVLRQGAADLGVAADCLVGCAQDGRAWSGGCRTWSRA